jgi:DNA-binding transcriptional ArsR family regulator
VQILSWHGGLIGEAGMTKNLPALGNSVILDDAPIIKSGGLSYRMGRCRISDLRPHPGNPRTHDRAHRRKLKKSIGKLGLGAPPVVDENFIILAGHARTEAGKELELTEIPAIQIFGLSEAKKRAYVLAHNRAALACGTVRNCLGISPATLSHHMQELEIAGLVDVVRDGQIRQLCLTARRA